jgi:uncharacterized protein (TIGR02271 family)
MNTLLELRGQDVVDPDGSKIGTFEELYLDDATGQPEWALVNTGLFGMKSNFVPLQGATTTGDCLCVAYTKDEVKDAPGVDSGEHLDPDQEAELYRHYGLQDGHTNGSPNRGITDRDADRGITDRDADRGITDRDTDRGTVGHDTSGPETDTAMTRSEEELKVGTAQRETGRARLRKYVTTEHVETTVPVRREEVRVEREPITDGNVDAATDGSAISEEEHEVVLHAEEPVVQKQVVPKERVRLDKEVTTEERNIDEDVRREEITIDEDAESRR